MSDNAPAGRREIVAWACETARMLGGLSLARGFESRPWVRFQLEKRADLAAEVAAFDRYAKKIGETPDALADELGIRELIDALRAFGPDPGDRLSLLDARLVVAGTVS